MKSGLSFAVRIEKRCQRGTPATRVLVRHVITALRPPISPCGAHQNEDATRTSGPCISKTDFLFNREVSAKLLVEKSR